MKKLTIILMVIIAMSITANAQTKQPIPTNSAPTIDSVKPTDSTTWKLARRFYYYIGGVHDEYTFLIDGTDTIYKGLKYKKINVSHHRSPGTVRDSIFPTEFFGGLRESDKKIYMWETWGTTDTTVKLVCDFNQTNVGETIFTNVLTGGRKSLFGHLITGTDADLVEGEFSKYFNQEDPSVTTSKIWNHFTDIWILSSDPSDLQFYFFCCP